MPTRSNRTKRLTRQDGLAPSTESTARGRANDMRDAPLVPLPSVGQCRSGEHTSVRKVYNMTVPVVDKEGKPLMPTVASRARRWIRTGEATPFFVRGIFCVRLNRLSGEAKQQIAVGIDPGSKKEGFTVKSASHTYLNIQADAVQHVKDAVEVRRNMRITRRGRKTRCRKNRINRARGSLPPSTKARWQWKLRIVAQLARLFPITDTVVEDIQAMSKKGQRRWNVNFSPLEVGKLWFYDQLKRHGAVHLKQGWETKELRDVAGLKKSKKKLSEVFEAHCVDSWVLANWLVGGHILPDNKQMLCVTPVRLHRRQLHMLQAAKGGERKSYGGTRSLGLKRGSLVEHSKHGLTYVGGTMGDRVSLHSLVDGKRLTQKANLSDIKFKSYNTWRTRLLPVLKDGVSATETR